MPKKLDKETQKVLSEGQRFSDLVGSDGWKDARNLLMDKIIDIQSVMNIDVKSPEEAVVDIKARRAAVEIVLEWLKDVEGRAEQYQSNKEVDDPVDHIFRA